MIISSFILYDIKEAIRLSTMIKNLFKLHNNKNMRINQRFLKLKVDIL